MWTMTCRLATALRHKEGLHKYMGTAWIIASGKGGVGKSTLSACLGMEIARNGQRVCIVDADIGLRDQDVLLGVQDCIVYDILDVANGICPVDDALVVPKPDALPNLSLLPASQFARAKELEAKAFRKILRTLKSNFDHVLIDAPAGIERSLRGLLSNEINECVLVCTPDDVCIRNAERTASVLRKKGLTAQRVIVNRLNPDYIRRGEMYAAQTVALTLDVPLLGEIPEDAEIYRALLHHQSVMEGESEGRNAIARIALRMTTDADVPLPEYGQKRTLFQRLFQRRRKGDEKHVR